MFGKSRSHFKNTDRVFRVRRCAEKFRRTEEIWDIFECKAKLFSASSRLKDDGSIYEMASSKSIAFLIGVCSLLACSEGDHPESSVDSGEQRQNKSNTPVEMGETEGQETASPMTPTMQQNDSEVNTAGGFGQDAGGEGIAIPTTPTKQQGGATEYPADDLGQDTGDIGGGSDTSETSGAHNCPTS